MILGRDLGFAVSQLLPRWALGSFGGAASTLAVIPGLSLALDWTSVCSQEMLTWRDFAVLSPWQAASGTHCSLRPGLSHSFLRSLQAWEEPWEMGFQLLIWHLCSLYEYLGGRDSKGIIWGKGGML